MRYSRRLMQARLERYQVVQVTSAQGSERMLSGNKRLNAPELIAWFEGVEWMHWHMTKED